ncbi:MAG: hypothetical protein D3924_04960 [Candidatus Electrothrix sp. AR4]|nr:hypothetical protein [Candidatus Electrothrix sp. AR4]
MIKINNMLQYTLPSDYYRRRIVFPLVQIIFPSLLRIFYEFIKPGWLSFPVYSRKIITESAYICQSLKKR